MIRRRTGGRRWVPKSQAQRELYATGRVLDGAAATVQMLVDDDFITDEMADELADLHQALRRVVEDIDERVGKL